MNQLNAINFPWALVKQLTVCLSDISKSTKIETGNSLYQSGKANLEEEEEVYAV